MPLVAIKCAYFTVFADACSASVGLQSLVDMFVPVFWWQLYLCFGGNYMRDEHRLYDCAYYMLNLQCQGRPALPLRHKGLLQFCVATIAEDFLGIVGD
jgi:hypothetical protein